MLQSFPKITSEETADEYRFVSLRGLSDQERPKLIFMAESFEDGSAIGGMSFDPAFRASLIQGYSTTREFIEATEFSQRGRQVYLIEHIPTGDFVGLRTYYNKPFRNDPHEWDVSNSTTYVAPYARGRNLGKLSLENLREMAGRHELEDVVMEVSETNIASISNLEFMVSAGLASRRESPEHAEKGKRLYELDTSVSQDIFWTTLEDHSRNKTPVIDDPSF